MAFQPLTVQDRILLHLMDYQNFSDKYEVPAQVTQRGIGEAIEIAWSNVPRAMKKLVTDGLVEEKSARIKGDKRKKKAYFLTHKGYSQALTLKQDLASRTLVMVDGEAHKEIAVGDLARETGLSFAFLSFVMKIGTDGKFDVARAKAVGATPAGVVEAIEGAPVVKNFVGRDSELSQLLSVVGSNQVAVVWGVAGVGKSTLAAKSVEPLRGKRSIWYARLRTWSNLGGVLLPFARFLGKLRRTKLLHYLSSTKQPAVGDLAPILKEDFEGIDAVASRQIKDLLHSFVARGGTVFLTSHILEIVERLSTHIGVIADGRIVAQGRIEEVRAGAQGKGTLEELFIELVGGERPAADLDWL